MRLFSLLAAIVASTVFGCSGGSGFKTADSKSSAPTTGNNNLGSPSTPVTPSTPGATPTPNASQNPSTVLNAKATAMQKEVGAQTTVGGLTGWNIWSNGTIYTNVTIADAGDYQIVVRAYGQAAGGILPIMDILVDNTSIKKQNVVAGLYALYSATATLSKGTHKISVGFTNDAIIGVEDRNLIVYSVLVSKNFVSTPPPSPLPTATPTPTQAPPVSSTPGSSGSYPYAGQKLFVSAWNGAARNVNSGYCPAQMQKMAAQPGSVWLSGSVSDMNSEMPQYLSQAASQGAMPTFVIYNIPGRDCGSYSAGGAASNNDYLAFVQTVARYIGNTRAAVIIEPDGLPNSAHDSCWGTAGAQEKIQLIKNAVLTIRNNAPNTAIYLDAGGPTWVSANEMASILNAAGVEYANGFSLNVSGYSYTDTVKNYGNTISSMTGNKHFVIDTSRNGNGGTNPYQWCNPEGQAVGHVPQAFNSGLIDAYIWVNFPGSSDGECGRGFPYAGAYMPQWACDMAYRAGW
jgi:endoglucanase